MPQLRESAWRFAAFHVPDALTRVSIQSCHTEGSKVCRQVRERPEKGCQVITWYLIDQTGLRHKAAQGEATRKSPFQYTACAPFALTFPMPYCTNQQQVLQWVKRFSEGGAPFVMDPIEGAAGNVPVFGRPLPPDAIDEAPVTSKQSPHSPVIVPPVSPEAPQNDAGAIAGEHQRASNENMQHMHAGSGEAAAGREGVNFRIQTVNPELSSLRCAWKYIGKR